jgi:hypothetical protein
MRTLTDEDLEAIGNIITNSIELKGLKDDIRELSSKIDEIIFNIK